MRHRAFTLVEVIAVAAILIIMLGLIVPVFSNANDRAHLATDTANLRQVGLGMSLYLESSESTVRELAVFANTFDSPELLQSKRDSTASGYAVEYANLVLKRFDPSHKYLLIKPRVSLLGADAFGLHTEECVLNDPSAGWAIIAEGMRPGEILPKPRNRYLRLNNDTSVVNESAPLRSKGTGYELHLQDIFCPALRKSE
ncbi:MAG: type II secretion system GspH family protein [Armatimonadetes bacterium]|nr:type II secretion system GspH family protein [Armatimonadota bacterium]